MSTRKKYTKEFKEDAVRLVLEQGYKQTEAARNLGVDRRMLARWIRESQGEDGEAFRGNGKLTAEGEDLWRLRETLGETEGGTPPAGPSPSDLIFFE